MRSEVTRLSSQLNALKRQREEQRNEVVHSTVASYTLAMNANQYMRSRVQMNQQMMLETHSALSNWMVSA